MSNDSRNLNDDRRRHQRVRVKLLGRYMLADHNEYACQTIDMSPGGVSLAAPAAGEIGERVVCYLEEIGRIEGHISRVFDGGFSIEYHATERKRERLAEKLTWLANRSSLKLSDGRAHGRFAPEKREAVLSLANGRSIACSIIDLSLGGASVAVDEDIDVHVGTEVRLGRTVGHVVRLHESGLSIRFLGSPDPSALDADAVDADAVNADVA